MTRREAPELTAELMPRAKPAKDNNRLMMAVHCDQCGQTIRDKTKHRRINITLPESLLMEIDAACSPRGRSKFLAQAAEAMLDNP